MDDDKYDGDDGDDDTHNSDDGSNVDRNGENISDIPKMVIISNVQIEWQI